jgi:predicted ABC-type ATPase
MIDSIPRLRMFAGPNGAGKSTMKSLFRSELLGIYINPDDIQYKIQQEGFIDFSEYKVISTKEEIFSFFSNSILLKKENLQDFSKQLKFAENKLHIPPDYFNSYIASVLSDFIRRKLVDAKSSFSFETVMSSPDKIEFLKQAQESSFRTYLYYIATDDPEINISRVKNRVKAGGHSVPQDKIISRYSRSLDLLSQAILYTNRAYIFDNSDPQLILLDEITNGDSIELKTDTIPVWFEESVRKKLVFK